MANKVLLGYALLAKNYNDAEYGFRTSYLSSAYDDKDFVRGLGRARAAAGGAVINWMMNEPHTQFSIVELHSGDIEEWFGLEKKTYVQNYSTTT